MVYKEIKMADSVYHLSFCHSSHPLCSYFELKLWWLNSTGVVSCLYEVLANGANIWSMMVVVTNIH